MAKANNNTKDKRDEHPKSLKTWLIEALGGVPQSHLEEIEHDHEKVLKTQLTDMAEEKSKEINDCIRKHEHSMAELRQIKDSELQQTLKEQEEAYKAHLGKLKLKVELHCKKYNIPMLGAKSKRPLVVQSGNLNFSDTDVARFKQKLTLLKIRISDEQEAMIFSTSPATNVLAGAGSGKSTTLVLRVVFLRLYLAVPLKAITVTTFTRESRKDFIKKLLARFEQFGSPIRYKDARSTVRTFHSVAWEVNKMLGQSRIIMGDKTPKIDEDDERGANIDNQMAEADEDTDDHIPDPTIPKLSNVLHKVYENEFIGNHNSPFRALILDLLAKSASHKSRYFHTYSPEQYLGTFTREDEVNEIVFDVWREQHPEILDCWRSPFVQSGYTSVANERLKYHLYLPTIDAKIFLFQDPIKLEENGIIDKPTKIYLFKKRKFCTHEAKERFVIVDSLTRLKELLRYEESMSCLGPLTTYAPIFSYRCIGESGSKNQAPIYKQFYELISFVYSLGRSLADLNDADTETFFEKFQGFDHITPGDKSFFYAARYFQIALESYLESQALTTFDQIFHQFSDSNPNSTSYLNRLGMSSITHLFIDESQDSSPNIINFLNFLKRIQLKAVNSKRGTIMAVGDEKQSIYGWRGSSPHFIHPESFRRTFPSMCQSTLTMKNNYRSSERILENAQNVVNSMISVVNDSYNVAGDNQFYTNTSFTLYPPVTIRGGPGLQDKTGIDYTTLTNLLEKEVKHNPASKDEPIFVLCRARYLVFESNHREWDELFKRYKKEGLVKCLTIHQSKGLEADTVIILGDIDYDRVYPLKNAIHHWAGLEGTYDHAQKEEAKRLCYVALTRAKRRLHWFTNKDGDDVADSTANLF